MTERQLECPDWLDESARAEWHQLVSRGVGDLSHPPTVAAYCFAQSWRRRLQEIVDDLGTHEQTTWRSADGKDRLHPAIALKAQLSQILEELSHALGFEPQGRETGRPTRIIFLDEGPPEEPG